MITETRVDSQSTKFRREYVAGINVKRVFARTEHQQIGKLEKQRKQVIKAQRWDTNRKRMI